eukprot:2236914-Prymnesium_polylepis.2
MAESGMSDGELAHFLPYVSAPPSTSASVTAERSQLRHACARATGARTRTGTAVTTRTVTVVERMERGLRHGDVGVA